MKASVTSVLAALGQANLSVRFLNAQDVAPVERTDSSRTFRTNGVPAIMRISIFSSLDSTVDYLVVRIDPDRAIPGDSGVAER